MDNKIVTTSEYAEFFAELKNTIRQKQLQAFRAVNKQLITLYWEIGKQIVLRQNKYGWGKSVVTLLAKDLQAEFIGVKGFSERNLWRMRLFYITYCDDKKLSQLVAEIGWSHNIIILEKCADNLQREYYLQMTRQFGWSRNILDHNIATATYESFLNNQTSFDKNLPDKYRNQAKLAVKDEYSFAFLELGIEHNERELEFKLINNIRQFLLEMGGYFTFVGSQYRVEVAGEEFFIDLLLYHRVLGCLIAVELKTGDFKPEYVGKMNFYLSALDAHVKLESEKPSIGIIICKNKNRTLVEYTLKDTNKPMGISTYHTTPSLPEKMTAVLPSTDEIIRCLRVFESDSEGG